MGTILARCSMMEGMAEALKAEGFKETGTVMQQAADTIKNLAKLAQDMWYGMCDHDRCVTCEHWNEGYNGCEFCARMQELEVEVNW